MLSVMTVVSMPSLHQLPRRQPGALQERPRLVGEHRDLLALLRGGANHAERRAVTGGRQRAGVAVREDPRGLRHQRRAVRAHRPAALHVLVVDRLRLDFEAPLDLVDRVAALRGGGERLLHALDRPEQIHRGRPRRGHQVADLLELGGELLGAGRRAAAHAERDAHRGRHANRRRAANHHRLDRLRDVFRRLAGDVDLGCRQLPLVDHHDRVVFPFNRRQHFRR